MGKIHFLNMRGFENLHSFLSVYNPVVVEGYPSVYPRESGSGTTNARTYYTNLNGSTDRAVPPERATRITLARIFSTFTIQTSTNMPIIDKSIRLFAKTI